MRFSICQQSRIGTRTVNQDRAIYRYTRDALLLVVADGMGGHANGELAAQIAVDYMAGLFEREARPRLAHPFIFLSRLLLGGHRAIVEGARARELPEAPRTTCVVCLVQDGAAYWAHSGDSRLYLLREGRTLAQTRDHTPLRMLIDGGLLSEEQARLHPERNRVMSCLGGDRVPQFSCSPRVDLRPGDLIALCSDGAWSPLPGARLEQLLAPRDVMQSVPRLLDAALAEAGDNADNATLIAVAWEGQVSAAAGYDSGFDRPEVPRQPRYAEPSDEELEAAVAQLRASKPHGP